MDFPLLAQDDDAPWFDARIACRQRLRIVGTREIQVALDLHITRYLDLADELRCECPADPDDPCAVGAGSPYARLVFALPNGSRAAAGAYAEYTGCVRAGTVVAADHGAVIGRMPDTPHSLTMRTLAENALRGTIVGTHHGAVIG